MNIAQLEIKPDLLESKLMSTKIAEILRENIISENLKPGEKINEYQLSRALNISRPPIREAFRTLTSEGLITLIPRKGVYVSKLSIREVKEIYQLKIMMESFATRLAIPIVEEKEILKLNSILNLMEERIKEDNFKEIQRLNIEFHKAMIRMSKNQRLINLYESIILPIRRYQRIGLSAPLSWETSLKEHRGINQAIKSKDINLAERLTREHTMSAMYRVIKRLKEEESLKS
jgi:DNA-binding GntR family transcriptional regulator